MRLSNLLMSLAAGKSFSRGYDAAFTTNSTLVPIVLRPQIHSIPMTHPSTAVLFFILGGSIAFFGFVNLKSGEQRVENPESLERAERARRGLEDNADTACIGGQHGYTERAEGGGSFATPILAQTVPPRIQNKPRASIENVTASLGYKMSQGLNGILVLHERLGAANFAVHPLALGWNALMGGRRWTSLADVWWCLVCPE